MILKKLLKKPLKELKEKTITVHKLPSVSVPIIRLPGICPAQQLVAKQCICINCKRKGECWPEKLMASDDCNHQWIKYCSLNSIENGKRDAIVDEMLTPYFQSLIDKWGIDVQLQKERTTNQ